MPDDTLTAALEEAKRIADGLQCATRFVDGQPDFTGRGGPAAESYWEYFTPARILSLLAALDEVLKLHRPQSSLTRKVCAAHAAGSKWRKSATLAEFRDEVDACPDCLKEYIQVCAHCECPIDDWPCRTYQVISRVLGTGEHQQEAAGGG